MKRLYKKLLLSLLSLSLLVSCTPTTNTNKYNGEYYIKQLEDYKENDKSKNSDIDNEEFDEFLDKFFIETMQSDYLTMHYSVVDYKSFDIEKPELSLGKIEYKLDKEAVDGNIETLEELRTFKYKKLSARQQYDYDCLEYSLLESLASLCFWKYDFPFSISTCIPENIISNFQDFTFYDQESVDDYLQCLKDIDRYIDDCLLFTQKQNEDGYGLLDEWIDYCVDCADGLCSKQDQNALITTFNKRIEKLDFLSDTQKEKYCSQNKQIVLDEVLPAYKKMANELVDKYYGKTNVEDYVLSKLDKEYAKLVYYLSGSSNTDLKKTWQLLKDIYSQIESEAIACRFDEETFDNYMNYSDGKADVLNLSMVDTLEYLRNNLKMCYPDLGEVEYDVEVLDPESAPDSAVAYYWPSPVDNLNQNIIRTNPNNMSDGLTTYNTLAHEGMPGHLYQNIYYLKTKPHNFRQALSFLGYVEGFAVMATYDAFKFSGVDDYFAASALFYDADYYLILYSIIDIGVNYFDWRAQDIIDYFDKESLFIKFDEESAISMREYLIETSGMYSSYGIGFTNLMNLRNIAREKLKDKFDLVDYNETILKNGPLPFKVLETAVDQYIEDNK